MTKKPGMAPTLTRDMIAAVALELAEEAGIQSVSIRKIAQALGKSPMGLYTYFESIQEIHACVVALAFREVDTQPIPGEPWDETLRRTMGSIRAMYRRHSRAALHLVEAGGYSAALAEHTSRIYALHEAQGIPEEILRQLWCIVDAFLGGFVSAETRELHGRPDHPDPAGRTWMATAENAYTDETFARGIDIIVAGVRALAAPDPCDWHTPS